MLLLVIIDNYNNYTIIRSIIYNINAHMYLDQRKVLPSLCASQNLHFHGTEAALHLAALISIIHTPSGLPLLPTFCLCLSGPEPAPCGLDTIVYTDEGDFSGNRKLHHTTAKPKASPITAVSWTLNPKVNLF